MNNPNIKFILDVHLARLCRYLRMAGLDSLWKSNYLDSELLQISTLEGRQLLTRDYALFCKSDPNLSYYVNSIYPKQQFQEIINHFKIKIPYYDKHLFLTRCLECNSAIQPLQPHLVPQSIPIAIRNRYHEFFHCSCCHRIYWKGSHFHQMMNWLTLNLMQ